MDLALKRRVLTAALLVPLMVWAVLGLPTPYLALLLLALALLGAFEWSALVGLAGCPRRLTYIVALALAAAGLLGLQRAGVAPTWPLTLAVGFWLLVPVRLARYRGETLPAGRVDPLQALAGLVVLLPAWLALVVLHGGGERGPALLLFLMILIWSADICAYFAGRRWGRIRLAPQVSPGKTREGLYGALAGALLLGGLLGGWLAASPAQAAGLVALCIVTTLFSVVGDLFESLMKRQRGVKDSGRLLPGHGGVLDRIDSLTAAAPVFVLGLRLVERL